MDSPTESRFKTEMFAIYEYTHLLVFRECVQIDIMREY